MNIADGVINKKAQPVSKLTFLFKIPLISQEASFQ